MWIAASQILSSALSPLILMGRNGVVARVIEFDKFFPKLPKHCGDMTSSFVSGLNLLKDF